jgi:hypothetical protein
MNSLNYQRAFNFLRIAMFLGAEIRSDYAGNLAPATYWCAASVLNIATLPGVSK